MNKENYIQKPENLLSDINTYKVVNKTPFNKLGKNVANILKSLNNNGYLDSKYHNNL